MLPGSQRAPDGTLQNVWSGLGGRAASVVGSLYGGPAVGALINRSVANKIDNGSWIPFGNGPLARLAGYGPPGDGGVLNAGGGAIGNAWNQLGNFRNMPPAYAGNGGLGLPVSTPQAPPPVIPQGQPDLGSMNLLNGGRLGNWAYQPQGGGGIRYGNGVGAGTGYGGSSYQNDPGGNVAAGFGLGVAGISGPSSYAISDAMSQNRKNRV